MQMKNQKLLILIIIALLLLSGCKSGNDKLDSELMITQAVQTMEAQMTETAMAAPTSTPTTEPSPTLPPTPIPSPTNTIQPITAPAAAANPPTSTCDVATFIDDITIPDGTTMSPGESFTKTWELRNDGTCTWNANYQLVFVSGNSMGGPTAVAFTTTDVAPGESIQISIDLVAPTTAGEYTANYMLQNAAGMNFGIGAYAGSFYVQINVSGSGSESSSSPTETSDGSSPTATSGGPVVITPEN